jgi:hypothetical protein
MLAKIGDIICLKTWVWEEWKGVLLLTNKPTLVTLTVIEHIECNLLHI